MLELRSREQALVGTHHNGTATDALCLLVTPELRAFVQEFKWMSRPWYSQKPDSVIGDRETNDDAK